MNGADGLNHADGARYLVVRPDPLMTAIGEEDRYARQLELTMPNGPPSSDGCLSLASCSNIGR